MSTNNNPLSSQLLAVFGNGTSINAELAATGRVKFHDPVTEVTLSTKLPDEVEFFGPGNYTIVVGTNGYEFTSAPV
jgi:hypothetical protein